MPTLRDRRTATQIDALASTFRDALRACDEGDWQQRISVMEQFTDAIALGVAEVIASEFNDEKFAGKSRLIDDQDARKEFVRRMNIVFHRWGIIVEPEIPTVNGVEARAVLCASGGRFDFGLRYYELKNRTRTTTRKSTTQPDGKHVPYFRFAICKIAEQTSVSLQEKLIRRAVSENQR